MEIALPGLMLKRTAQLEDPKNIFNYFWTEFCSKAEKGMLAPLVFFIKPEMIEVFNFGPFTESDKLKKILAMMIKARVSSELDIEGVALCFEAFLRQLKMGATEEDISKKPSECSDAKDAVILSLCWRGVDKTFMRAAEKIPNENGFKLVEIPEMREGLFDGGTFSNFFGKSNDREPSPRKEFFA